jgi:beta-lactamase superfamily II metal-dependent hydrolase
MNTDKICRLLRKAYSALIILVLLLCMTSCDSTNEKTIKYPVSDLTVSFIDVGQGDSILIQCNSESMLIDAGENNKGEAVTEYLKNHGTDSLKYAVGTHPHSDHIGGMDTVLNNISTDTFICPETTYDTKTWTDVIDAAKSNGTEIVYAKPYQSYTLGEAEFTIFAPQENSVYSDSNNYSVVIKLEYGENSFLFTGDAEEISEKEMLSADYDLKADVLKVGHHGSSGSSCQEFIDKVNPEYAVISCGEDNDYGHPHKETLQRLKNTNVLRTDLSGDIIIVSNGKTLTVGDDTTEYSTTVITETETETTATVAETTAEQQQYVGNKNSKKYHKKSCPSVEVMLDKNKVYFSNKKEADEKGYTPCKSCMS